MLVLNLRKIEGQPLLEISFKEVYSMQAHHRWSDWKLHAALPPAIIQTFPIGGEPSFLCFRLFVATIPGTAHPAVLSALVTVLQPTLF